MTHVPVNACPRRSHFSMHRQKKRHTSKKETHTLPPLRPNKHVSFSTHTTKCEGVYLDTHRVFLRCWCVPSYPPPHPQRCMLCCGVHMRMQICVCARGRGAHMRMHASSVLIALSVCVMQHPTHFDNLFFVFYLL